MMKTKTIDVAIKLCAIISLVIVLEWSMINIHVLETNCESTDDPAIPSTTKRFKLARTSFTLGNVVPNNNAKTAVNSASEIYQEFEDTKYNYTKRYNIHIDVRPEIILGPKDDYEFDTLSKIPLIIHQTHKNHTLSIMYKEWMQSWLKFHPNWQYWFWTDEDIKKLITARYPDFENIFFKFPKNIQRSDAFRYFVLHEFGGIYADCDMECFKPLDDPIGEHNCILSTEPAVHRLFIVSQRKNPYLISNAFMACRPRHPFFKHTIDFLVNSNSRQSEDPVFSTGPVMVAESYKIFTEMYTDDVVPFVPDEELFLPKFDPRRIAEFRKLCRHFKMIRFKRMKNPEMLDKSCKPLLDNVNDEDVYNGPTDKSYTVHHWTNSWAGKLGEYYLQGLENKRATFNVKNLYKADTN